jgi:hypothetical protein
MASAIEMVARHVGDLTVHLVGDPAVGGVPGRLRPQLDEMERLAGAHLHHEPDVGGEGDDVLGDVGSQLGPHRS